MHDGTLARTTDVAAVFPGREHDAISTFTLAELKQLDAGNWKAPQFIGEQIPTLSEALTIMPLNVWVNLDIKGWQFAFGGDIANTVLDSGREH